MKNLKPINEKQEGDSGYVCHFGGRQCALYAASSYKAQLKAQEYFKPKKSKKHMVSAMLAERADGTPYAQSTAQFG